MKYTALIAVAALVLLGGGYYAMTAKDTPSLEGTEHSTHGESALQAEVIVEETTEATEPSSSQTDGVKEFSVDSWMEKKGEVMSAHFSLKEIRVKKGDTVRITITNTAGNHDFVIDEFGVAKETPLNQKTVVEFVADKAGTFEYYCSKYNHRQLGQVGKLIVEE